MGLIELNQALDVATKRLRDVANAANKVNAVQDRAEDAMFRRFEQRILREMKRNNTTPSIRRTQ